MGARRAVALPIGLALLMAPAASACRAPESAAASVAASTPFAARSAAADSFRSSRTYSLPAAPVRVRIPAAGVDSRLERVRRAADGTMGLPRDAANAAAWWAEGPRPGQRGPAVIVGHVDWERRPAVFFRLDALRRGDLVYVDRADGTTGRFRVNGTRQVPKDRFPTELVYAPSLEPALRLITCGGEFDRTAKNYRDNVIVFAVPA